MKGVATATMASAGADGSLRLLSGAGGGETTASDVVMPDLSIVFQMLSSDDDGSEHDDDDAATTMGSPIPAAQTLPPSPLPPEASEASVGLWTQRRPQREAAVSSDAKRIDDLFAALPTASCDRQEYSDEEDTVDSQSVVAPRPTELLLSPASQLHVLSQISEMAESRAARERQAAAAAATAATSGSSLPMTHPLHAWAPIAHRAQSQPPQPPQKSSAKRKSTATKQAASKKARATKLTIPAGFLVEVETWGALNEPILEGDDDDEADWSFEELSDSDF